MDFQKDPNNALARSIPNLLSVFEAGVFWLRKDGTTDDFGPERNFGTSNLRTNSGSDVLAKVQEKSDNLISCNNVPADTTNNSLRQYAFF